MKKLMLKKRKTMSLLFTLVGFMVTFFIAFNELSSTHQAIDLSADRVNQYQIILDNNNQVVSDGDTKLKTLLGNDVTFTYSGTKNSSDGHVSLKKDGILTNKDHIRSIESIICDFTGNLKFRVSYGGGVYSNYTTMTSNYLYQLSSNPYFVEFYAEDITDINRLQISYTCSVNDAAHEGEGDGNKQYELISSVDELSDGKYLIVSSNQNVAFDGSLSKLDAVGNVQNVSIDDDVIADNNYYFEISKVNSNYVVKSSSGYYIGRDSDTNGLLSSQSVAYTNSISFDESGNANIVGSGGAYLRFNSSSNQNRFRYYKSSTYDVQRAIQLYKYVVNGPTYETPAESEIGFTAIDNKANNYQTTDVYDLTNSLVVTAEYTGGESKLLKNNEYTYKVFNEKNQEIDSAKEFGVAGEYLVIVYYKNYIPCEIKIHVSEPVILNKIEVNCNKLIYNTADYFDVNNVSVNLSFTDPQYNKTNVSYQEFDQYGLKLALINPNSVDHDLNNVLGIAGTWKIKVSDENISDILEIEVEAILISDITINSSSTTLVVGKTLQLQLSITPQNATNQDVVWSSEHENIATVSTGGLVKAISEGTSVIKAMSLDGSNVFGSIEITVVAKPQYQDEGLYHLSNEEIKVGMYITFVVNDNNQYYAMGEQANNNRQGVAVDVNSGYLLKDNNSSFKSFLVKEGNKEGTISFYDIDNDGYLYAASSSNNYLRTETNLSDNSSFVVSSGSENRNIVAQGSNTNNRLLWNTGSLVFSCYSSNSVLDPVNIYVKEDNPIYPTAITISSDSQINIGEVKQLSVAFIPENTTVKILNYVSSDESVATVSSTGLVTGVKEGNVIITAYGYNNEIKDEINITVTSVPVSSVSLNKTSTELKVGESETLYATINPTNATNKSVNWSSSDNDVVSVENGMITAKKDGTAIITVTTLDGNKTATCNVSVIKEVENQELVITFKDNGRDSRTSISDLSGQVVTGEEYISSSSCSTVYPGNGGLKFSSSSSNGSLTIALNEIYAIYSITANVKAYGSDQSYLSINSVNQQITSTSFADYAYELTGEETNQVTFNATKRLHLASITISCKAPEPVNPTSITITPSSVELANNGSKQLSVTYYPSNANQNKDITWSSSNTSVATVDSNGKVVVTNTASIGSSAVITATLTNLPTISATCTVTVVDTLKADQTILIYLCGSDLESGTGNYATSDLTEILSVSNQPDNVNIVIETGGAKSWSSKYGISSTKLQRYHVSNKQLVLDSSLTYQSMGESSTLQSFMEYGLNNYPADRTGLILWNHGGGMQGVCYDEKYDYDSLLDYEVKSAVTNALNNTGNSNNKLEWIGYDACLMQVQDIAEMNSSIANYMVGSEESEAGEGWDYDTWVDDLYQNKPTETILTAIVDGFIEENDAAYEQNGWGNSDQTLSWLDLSYASEYLTKWENMAKQLQFKFINSSVSKSTFNTLIKSCKHYADSDYSYFGLFDAKDFLNKLSNQSYNPGSTYINEVLSVHADLVRYNRIGSGAGNSYGLAMFWSVSSDCYQSYYYTENDTNFSTWRSLNSSYGY